MKVSAAHLEAFIGAIEDCGFNEGHIFVAGPHIVIDGVMPGARPGDTNAVRMKVAFDPTHGIPASAYPPAMVRAHVAAALNREHARIGWSKFNMRMWDDLIWKHFGPQQ